MRSMREFALIAFIVAAGILLPAATTVAMQIASPVTGSTATTGQRFLDGSFVRWDGDRLITSVGTYHVGDTVTVEDRAHTRSGETDGEKETDAQHPPRVELEFEDNHLVRVVIY